MRRVDPSPPLKIIRRSDNKEFLIGSKEYFFIQNLLKFYKENISLLPDYECVNAKPKNNSNTSVTIKVNEIIFT